MNGVARALHRFQSTRPVQVIEISGLCDVSPACVEVVTATGQVVRLPRSQCQFAPRRVVVPAWLYDKIFTRARGNAPQAPHPAGRSQPSCPR